MTIIDNHLAIYRAYPNAVLVQDDPDAGTTTVYDGNRNVITIELGLVDAAAAEIDTENNWKNLRDKRNELLAETDRFALADLTMTDEMAAYRQALRDLPANTADPANPVWPVKPGSEEPAAE